MGCRGRAPEGWYLGPGNWLLRLLGTKLLHGVIVLLLFLCHEDVFPSKVQWDGARKVGESPFPASRISLPQTSPVKPSPIPAGGPGGKREGDMPRGPEMGLEGGREGGRRGPEKRGWVTDRGKGPAQPSRPVLGHLSSVFHWVLRRSQQSRQHEPHEGNQGPHWPRHWFKVTWWDRNPGSASIGCADSVCEHTEEGVVKAGGRRGPSEGRTRGGGWLDTHLLLLLVEVVDDDANEEVEGEEGAEDDEDDEIQVHVEVHLVLRLLFLLQRSQARGGHAGWAQGTRCLLPVPL